MFGFYFRGDSNHLILGDDHPVLAQRWKGRLLINEVPADGYAEGYADPYRLRRLGYGYCTVTYPEPIRTTLPPFVFGVPTGACDNKGLGLFCHRGGPGNWVGFSVMITCSLFAEGGQATMGFDSGWEYRVCVFGNPGTLRPGATNFGLRLWGPDGQQTFDSNWAFVPFRGLLGRWERQSYTRHYDFEAYFGNPESGGDVDNVLVKGTHDWGALDGTLGVLISSLGVIPLRHDVGNRNITTPGIVTIGFSLGMRDKIWSVAYEGRSQHPAGDVSAMDGWRLLTADFTYV